MLAIKNIPIGSVVCLWGADEAQIANFKVEKEGQVERIGVVPEKISFMVIYAEYHSVRLTTIDEEQPISIPETREIDVMDILIPDPIHGNGPSGEQDKFPFKWMADKLELTFRDGENPRDSLDGAYSRIITLASILEASLSEILLDDSINNHQTCPACGNSLSDLNSKIDHLTSRGCTHLGTVFPYYAGLDKPQMRAGMHTVRKARNKLVHRLQVTSSDLHEIEETYKDFRPPPYGKNRWEKLSDMSVQIYCYLTPGIFHSALTHRSEILRNMHYKDYLDTFTDQKQTIVSCVVEY